MKNGLKTCVIILMKLLGALNIQKDFINNTYNPS